MGVRVWAGGLAALVLVAGVALGACSASPARQADDCQAIYERLPSMEGAELNAAWNAISSAGLYPKVEEVASDEPAGTVLSVENPTEGVPADASSLDPSGVDHPDAEWIGSVVVTVAAEQRVPPLVLGPIVSEEQVRSALAAGGCANVEFVYEGEADPERCRIVDISPEPMERLPAGQPVTVTLTGQSAVPDLVGLTPPEATTALIEAGLEVTPHLTGRSGFTDENGSPIPDARVVAQEPAAGEVVPLDTAVTLSFDRSLEDYS